MLSMMVEARLFKSQLDRAGERVLDACSAALYTEAESIIADSVPLVPWDKGILKGSHFVDTPEKLPDNVVEVAFGYGGAASAYAWVQHEHTEYRHPRGGQAKYLSAAVEQHEADLDDRLATHAQEWLKRHGG